MIISNAKNWHKTNTNHFWKSFVKKEDNIGLCRIVRNSCKIYHCRPDILPNLDFFFSLSIRYFGDSNNIIKGDISVYVFFFLINSLIFHIYNRKRRVLVHHFPNKDGKMLFFFICKFFHHHQRMRMLVKCMECVCMCLWMFV